MDDPFDMACNKVFFDYPYIEFISRLGILALYCKLRTYIVTLDPNIFIPDFILKNDIMQLLIYGNTIMFSVCDGNDNNFQLVL